VSTNTGHRARRRVRLSHGLRTAVGALLAGLTVMLIGQVAWGDTTVTVEPIDITGVGSWGPFKEMTAWQNALSDAVVPINLRYTPHGTLLGRQEFLDGNADFVMTGTPFTGDELAKLKNGAKDLIDVPIQVSSLGMLLARPYPNGFKSRVLVCDPDDPNTPDPTICIQDSTYNGDDRPDFKGMLKVPSDNLAAMLVGYSGKCPPPPAPEADTHLPLGSWSCNTLLDAFGLPHTTTWIGMSPTAGPVQVLRSDADETNYFVQQFVKTAAPNVWAGVQAETSQIQWEPIGERFPRLTQVASRDGAQQQTEMLGFPDQNPKTGNFSNQTAGILAPAPASAIDNDQGWRPPGVALLELKNKHGDWVGPTPATIDAAVDAGGDTPLYALDHDVPNAYPLVWVNHLYVRSSGLSVDQTEGLATIIRYLATDGQAVAKDVGEGRLPSSLVDEALAGADDIVKSNCTQSDAIEVKSSDPGPYAPDGAGMNAIGPMLHCFAKATVPTTSTTIPTTFSTAPFSPSSGSVLTPGAIPPAVSDSTTNASTSTVKKSKTISAALTVAKLPMPEPHSNGPEFDRTTTLLAGAAGFLLLRGPTKRFLGRLTT